MDFRTKIPPTQTSLRISHQDRALCTGSCFAERIGSRLERLQFPVSVNPFGIVYNPISLGQGLEKLLSDEQFGEPDLFENLGLWHSFAHHGDFSFPDKKEALEEINRTLTEARAFLSQTNRLFVTLGTANVFVFKKTGEVVANCHKVPGQQFERRRLGVQEVAGALSSVFQKLKTRLPALEIIATVSPVRYLRDGLVENQRGKATLVLALEELCNNLPFIHYFPAYEIVLDDLRDYRFFDADMAHPSQLAVDYVWQHFEQAYFDEKTKDLCQQVRQVTAASGHRPFHPKSEEHQVFVKKQLETMASLESRFPFLDFSNERLLFEYKG